MQTRKRAKSVSFGKKHKEEKEEVKHTTPVESVSQEPNMASEKAEVVERRPVHEKPMVGELSDTPPKEVQEEQQEEVQTPPSEFVTDSPLSGTPELPKEGKEQKAEEPPAAEESGELPQPVETPAQPGATEQTQQQGSGELSDTLPTSAFTIQSTEQPAQAQQAASVPEGGGKKRFGLYFIVVAFLSFILGLGAMAAASYFGFFRGSLPALPLGLNVSTILGHKPTPTTIPPTVAPTQKPVDLTVFTISVLNGSGKSGAAAGEKSALTTAGFNVTSTGNADNSNFTKTEIAAKKSVDPAFLKKLEDELGKSYTVDISVATSPNSSPADVTVTLGSDTAQ